MSRDPLTLVDRMLHGDRLALARLITQVENRSAAVPTIMKGIHGRDAGAYVVGVTGPPGAGKSTIVDRLTSHLRAEGRTVGVVAVDPSSPFTGGAVLGDRIRMQTHTLDLCDQRAPCSRSDAHRYAHRTSNMGLFAKFEASV